MKIQINVQAKTWGELREVDCKNISDLLAVVEKELDWDVRKVVIMKETDPASERGQAVAGGSSVNVPYNINEKASGLTNQSGHYQAIP